MITTSDKWKEYSAEHDIYHIKAILYDWNRRNRLDLTDEDFMFGTVKFTDAVSSDSSFDIGAVITNTFEATLNNVGGKFDGFNLDHASLTVKFGIVYEDSTEEWIQRGIYTVDKPYSIGATIQITAYDHMDYLNRTYAGKDYKYDDITFPISSTMLCDIMAEVCGLDNYISWNLPIDSVIDEPFEYNESTTWREVLGYICQINGGYARADANGGIAVQWYKPGAMSESGDLDGGTISPWSSSTSANGGTMNPWNTGYVIDGGHSIGTIYTQVASYNMFAEDIPITGVRVYVPNTVNEFEFATNGTQGYILSITDNPLVTSANKDFICADLWDAVSGMQIRPFTASIYGDPSIEAGDMISLYDYQGNLITTYVTNMVYLLNGLTELSCGAETPSNLSNDYASTTTSTIAGAVSASYDYIRAKKISADYIDAGTIEASVVARNLTMEGGSIAIETDDSASDYISLQYRVGNENTEALVSTSRISFEYNDGNGSDVISTLSYEGIEVTENGYGKAMLSANGGSVGGNWAVSGDVTSDGSMYAKGFVNTSRIDLKENLSKVGSVLGKIKDADILSFNFTEDAKKHIGLAIGGDYNVPEEVIAKDEDGVEQGVDLYAMVSMSWKAIQEQQEIIEQLEARVEALEKKLNPFGNLKDIVKGDTDGNTI